MRVQPLAGRAFNGLGGADVKEVPAHGREVTLCRIMFKLLTGQRAFGGTSPYAITDTIINQRPPSVAALRPDLPEPLIDIIDRAMARRPGHRFTTSTEMAATLRTTSGVMPPPVEELVTVVRPPLPVRPPYPGIDRNDPSLTMIERRGNRQGNAAQMETLFDGLIPTRCARTVSPAACRFGRG
jgi:serine/threonine protein kinase